MGILENKQAIKVNMLFGDENRAWHDSPLDVLSFSNQK